MGIFKMSTDNDIPEMLLTVSLTNLEDNPELLNILKCYFEGIPGISKITTLEECFYINVSVNYVYIHTDYLAKTLYKFYYNFYDYVKVYSLFTATSNKLNNIVYDSMIHCNKLTLTRQALEQYTKDM